MKTKQWLLGLLALHVASVAHAGTAFSLDDVKFWVGSGQKKAVLVIDWAHNSASDEALAWGYRWDGDAVGEDMLCAVVAADPRLYARLHDWGQTRSMVGLGYDLNHNGLFGISDGAVFDGDGISLAGSHDGATATDLGDLYKEGWFTGFWNYAVSASGNPFGTGHWESSWVGISERILSDGDWDGFTYETDWGFDSFPENPHAASVPESATIILVIGGLLAVSRWRWPRRISR